MQTDISIYGQGFFCISSNTEAGANWLRANVPDSYWDESVGCQVVYSDDQNLTQNIAEGATSEGLAVAVDGYMYRVGGIRGEKVE